MTPRTGSTAVGTVMLDCLDGRYLPEEDIVGDDGRFIVPRKHTTLDQLIRHGILDGLNLDDIRIFTTVRNHFDSLYSIYVKKRDKYQYLLKDRDSWVYRVPGYADDMLYCKEHDFDEWIQRRFGVSRIRRLLGQGKRNMYGKYTANADYVMRMETLQEDFDKVLRDSGIEERIIIPRINRTSERDCADYRKAYSGTSRKTIEYVYGAEMKRFGYVF